MNKRWTLVLKNHETGKQYVWHANYLKDVLKNMQRYFRTVNDHSWSKEADAIIRLNYKKGDMTARDLAVICTKLLGRRVTKNAVIGRYHKIIELSPDEITYLPKLEDNDTFIGRDEEESTNAAWKDKTRVGYN